MVKVVTGEALGILIVELRSIRAGVAPATMRERWLERWLAFEEGKKQS